MNTRQAINEVAFYFISKGENPSATDIRLALNDLVKNHDYAQSWAVKQVKAQIKKANKLEEEQFEIAKNQRLFFGNFIR